MPIPTTDTSGLLGWDWGRGHTPAEGKSEAWRYFVKTSGNLSFVWQWTVQGDHGVSSNYLYGGKQLFKEPKYGSFLPRTYNLPDCENVSGGAEGCVCRSRYRLCFGNCSVLEHTYVSYMHVKDSTVVDVCRCPRMHSYAPRDKKSECKTRSESHQHRTIWNVRKLFSVSNTAQLEALVIGNDSDPIPQTTEKHWRKIMRDENEEEDIIVDPGVLPNRSQK